MSTMQKELTHTSSKPWASLGDAFSRDGKTYVFVQYSSGSTANGANGTVVYATFTNPYVVTNDVSDISELFNSVAGVLLGDVEEGYYCYMQVWGAHSAIKTNGDDDIAQGAILIGDTTDGVCDSIASGSAITFKPIGYATAADSDTNDTVAGFITIGGAMGSN